MFIRVQPTVKTRKRNTQFNLPHLQEKLIDSQYIDTNIIISCDDIKKMLIERFNEIDFEQAKEDVIPFIKDPSVLDIWSKEFFIAITNQLNNE